MIILNFDMPIKDGPETCENIRNLFISPNLFDNDNFMLYIDESIEMGQCYKRNKIFKVKTLHKKMPFLVANLNVNLTPEVQNQLGELGFDIFIKMPITNEKIIELIEILEIQKASKEDERAMNS